MKNKIGIVGQGFVGTAVKEGLKTFFDIETHDIAKESTCDTLHEICEKCNIIFVCLPTPMKDDGSCYVGIVEEVLEKINALSGLCKTVIVKSTIPPGTTAKWNIMFEHIDIVFNPEFLTEANSVNDFKNQSRIIIGGPKAAASKVRRVFVKAFPKVKIIKTDSTYAEMVKYITNSFLAMKVSFANEMYQICNGLDIDYDKVVEYAMHDERLGYSHWSVPGPDGDLGYGGHCFPKDVKALIKVAHELNVSPRMLTATDMKNNDVRNDRDWEGMEGRAVWSESNKEDKPTNPLDYLPPHDYQLDN
jgi:UDPglucose 6-dehydrogenase|tara:strand:+ start:92 stop:1000 length:909 start_codon:yes stop_codon:yes gene_type:complete